MKKIVYLFGFGGLMLAGTNNAHAQCAPAINQLANPQITSANPNLSVGSSSTLTFRAANAGLEVAPAGSLQLVISLPSATNIRFEPPYLNTATACGVWTVNLGATADDVVTLVNTGGTVSDGDVCDLVLYIKGLVGGQTEQYSVTVNRLQPSCVGDTDPTAANNTKNATLTTMAVLPVTLGGFNARASNCNVQLDWNSKMEASFARYEIQHSQGGNEYRTIGTIEPKGSNSNYTFAHDNAPEGTNYYRLKMVDHDGMYEFSTVQKVNTVCSNIQLAPTVTSGTARVLGLTGNETINVVNNLGQILISQQAKGTETMLDLGSFATGLYQVIVTRGTEQVFAGKVVKQ